MPAIMRSRALKWPLYMPTLRMPSCGSLVIKGAVTRIPPLKPGPPPRTRGGGQPQFLKLPPLMDPLLRRAALHGRRLDRMRQGMAPFFIDLRRLLASHAQGQNFSRSSVHAGDDFHVITVPFGIGYLLIQKGLTRLVG